MELASVKERADKELEEARARSESALLMQKSEFDRQMAMYQTDLATKAARADRIRQEIVRWANPILGSVVDLMKRLQNILREQGYLALSPDTQSQVNPEWSISHDYFLPSTIYLFCRYFCWVQLLEQSLSFELFEEHDAKDNFFRSIRSAGSKLSAFPLAALENLPRGDDCQVFSLQQRAMGEAITIRDPSELRCMFYSEFLVKWVDPTFTRLFDPMTRFVSRLQPANARRWKRLELMAEALEQVHHQCETLLTAQDTMMRRLSQAKSRSHLWSKAQIGAL